MPDDFLTRVAAAERRDAGGGAADRAKPPRKASLPRRRAASNPAIPKASYYDANPKARGGRAPSKATRASSPARQPVAAKPAARNVSRELLQFGFKVLGPIAAGAFSTVVRAEHVESGLAVAVKTFESAKCAADKAKADERDRELDVLRLVSELGHAHIANLLGLYESAQGWHAMLHYCGGGSLLHHLDKLRRKKMAMCEGDTVVATAQIASALSHIHSLGACHRDVKPGNVLYDGQRWRLCDFGFAIVCAGRRLKRNVGTHAYQAPEMLSLADGGYLGRPVDMWAFGCMVYEMLLGRPAFIAPSLPDLKLRIRNGFCAPWLPHVKPEARRLITALLQQRAEDRPAADDVLRGAWVVEWCTPGDAEPTGEAAGDAEADAADADAAEGGAPDAAEPEAPDAVPVAAAPEAEPGARGGAEGRLEDEDEAGSLAAGAGPRDNGERTGEH